MTFFTNQIKRDSTGFITSFISFYGKSEIIVFGKLCHSTRYIRMPYSHRFARNIQIGNRFFLGSVRITIRNSQISPCSIGYQHVIYYLSFIQRKVSIITCHMAHQVISRIIGFRRPHTVTNRIHRFRRILPNKRTVGTVTVTEPSRQLSIRGFHRVEVQPLHGKTVIGNDMRETGWNLQLFESDIGRIRDNQIDVITT